MAYLPLDLVQCALETAVSPVCCDQALLVSTWQLLSAVHGRLEGAFPCCPGDTQHVLQVACAATTLIGAELHPLFAADRGRQDGLRLEQGPGRHPVLWGDAR